MMSTAIAEPVKAWPDLVHEAMPMFERISRANQLVTWEEESQFAIQAIQKNDSLAKCAPHTVQNAIINVAAVGLTLNPADGYAYLVPEYNKVTRGQECQLRISFKGLVKAATDTGAISLVKAEIVKENDVFEYRGPLTKPEHTMNPFGDRGKSVGVYCIAKTCEDEYIVDVMSWDEVLKIKDCAKTKMVWDKWEDEMAKKAIIKRAAKQWPKTDKSQTLHKAVEVINEGEGTDFDPFAQLESTAAEMLNCIENNDLLGLGQLWVECDKREQETLWTAKTKGGWFTMDEKTMIRAATSAYHKANEESDND